MKKISLTRGKFALVDDDMYEYLNQWKWCAKKDMYTYYAYRRDYSLGKHNSKSVIMHRVILGLTDPKKEGEHLDGNGINNQIANLRVATRSQNCSNRRSFKNSSSKYKGVSWKHNDTKWRASICLNKRCYHIGYYKTQKAAAMAYNEWAIKLHGIFARLNVIK